MKPEYHRRITLQALAEHVSPAALEAIVAANLAQDALRFQFGHDHYHYDNNSFAASDAYIEEQRHEMLAALVLGDAAPAWRAFGRLIHTAQDFYAHSNYVTLWRERHPEMLPDEIPPRSTDVSTAAPLHSGRLYYPLEILSFVPIFERAVAFFLPHDAHAWMNKDDPSRPDFDLAYFAAVKRTGIEFQTVVLSLPVGQANLFKDRS